MDPVPIMIAIIAMIAATSSSIVAIINSNTAKNNLTEVIENNRRALRPFLIIKSKEIDIVFDVTEKHLLNWDSKDIVSNHSFKSPTYIELASLSNGIAKNVWIIMEIKNVDFLLKALANSDSDITINLSEDKEKKLNVSGKSLGYNFEPIVKGFIAVEKGGNYKIPLPAAFIILFNIVFLYSLKLEPEEFPYLEFTITLEDIIGIPYKHEYLFKLHSANAKTKVNAEGITKSAKAIFDIREKN